MSYIMTFLDLHITHFDHIKPFTHPHTLSCLSSVAPFYYYIVFFHIIQIKENVQYSSFWDQLISLLTISSSIHFSTKYYASTIFMTDWYICIYYKYSHPPVGILAIVYCVMRNMNMQVCLWYADLIPMGVVYVENGITESFGSCEKHLNHFV